MRIAFITTKRPDIAYSGGMGSYFGHAALCLAGQGHEVEIFTSGEKEGNGALVPGVRMHCLGSDRAPFFTVHAAEAIQHRHREAPFDVVESGEYLAEGLGAVLLLPEIAHVVRLHSPSAMLDKTLYDPLPVQEWLRLRWGQIRQAVGAWRRGLPVPSLSFQSRTARWSGSDVMERSVAQAADVILVMNEEMRGFVRDYWCISDEQILERPNPYHFPPSLPTVPASTHPVIGYAGRLERRKGVRVLAQALCRVLPRYPEWHFVAAGGFFPGDRTYVEEMHRMLAGLGDRVRFTGVVPRNEMPAFYAGLDICVFPSLWETFHYTVLEAMLAGKAVIGGRTGAVAHMLDEGGAGLIVEPGSVSQLENALDRLMGDADLRRKLGAAAHARVHAVYNEKAITGSIVDAYKIAMTRRDLRLKKNRPPESPVLEVL